MSRSNKLACLILAAGQSVRFGGNKMRYPLQPDAPMLGVTVGLYQQVFDHVAVVCNGDGVTQALVENLGAQVIFNQDALEGMSSSIVSGVTALDSDIGWMIALGDMPFVKPETIQTLADLAGPDCIVRPRFQGQGGHPVCFGRRFKPQLLNLTGDAGAKPVVSEFVQQLVDLDVDDSGVLHDVDCLDDLSRPPQSA